MLMFDFKCISQTTNAELDSNRRYRMSNAKEALWAHCPICGAKTRTKVYFNTVLIKFPLFCPKCKNETLIDVVQFKMALSREPDA